MEVKGCGSCPVNADEYFTGCWRVYKNGEGAERCSLCRKDNSLLS